MYRRFVKPLFDFLVASAMLLGLTPVLLATAVIVRIRLGSPVLFAQERIGKADQPFTVYKFRSMTDVRNESGELLSDDARLTPTGRILRATSLDELPQLWNVLRGEMSLVGPRPLIVEYLPHYNSHQARRHEVRPGITGWAQVNGRNTLCWEDRFDHDVHYVDNVNALFDFKIMTMTVLKVLLRSDVNSQSQTPLRKFQGTPEPVSKS